MDIKKAELEVTKKQTELDNISNERNVQMFINGRWQWVADSQQLAEARRELNDAQFELEQTKLDQANAEDNFNTENSILNLNYAWDSAMKQLEGRLFTSTEYLGSFGSMLDAVTNDVLMKLYDDFYGEGASDDIVQSKYGNSLFGEEVTIPRSVLAAAKTIDEQLKIFTNKENSEKDREIAAAKILDAASEKLAKKGYTLLANTLAVMDDNQRAELIGSLERGSKDFISYYDPQGLSELSDWYKELLPDKTANASTDEMAVQITNNADKNTQKIVDAIRGEISLTTANEITWLKGQYESATGADKEYIGKLLDQQYSGLNERVRGEIENVSYSQMALIYGKMKQDAGYGLDDKWVREYQDKTLNDLQYVLENQEAFSEEEVNSAKINAVKQLNATGITNTMLLNEKSTVEDILNAVLDVRAKIGNLKPQASSSSSANSASTSKTTFVNGTLLLENDATRAMKNAINNGSTGSLSSSFASRYPGSIFNLKLSGAATGTRSALRSLYQINEIGEETFVTPDGHFRNFAGGEVVFTHEQSQRLFSLLNADLFDAGSEIGKVGNFEQSNSNDTYINIGGISVDTSSQDGQKLVEILQRLTNL